MQSRWNDRDLAALLAAHAGLSRDLIERVYTSRLLGQDPALVLHGGGNTSVKITATDVFGRPVEVLHVKGSGSDLAVVGPEGLPALELAPLRALRALPSLGDREMVNELRRRLLQADAPNPSVETLLHAFLPHKFVDHTHADAICALSNQPDGERRIRDALGADVAVLPWIMPGFPLAKAVADAFEAQPDCIGVVLLQHGIFTFGDTAKQSYERMIGLVDRAERHLQQLLPDGPPLLRAGALPAAERRQHWRALLPLLRAALAPGELGGNPLHLIAELRDGDAAAAFSGHAEARALCDSGPVTPDHVIRTKRGYLYLSRAEAADPQQLHQAVTRYVAAYRNYFETCATRRGAKIMLWPLPVVVMLEGCGLCALQPTRKAARIAADIAERTVAVWAAGHALGRYTPLSPDALAEMEYWPLELDKLGRGTALPLQGQIALITGAAGAIGCGIAEELLEAGACALLTDVDAARLERVVARLHKHRERIAHVVADLCDPAAVERVFDAAVWQFGGVDLVVPNAGIAHVSTLAEMQPERFRQVMEVNATATMFVLQAAARLFAQQGKGGSVVLQASKNVFAPGAGFGAYSASKAAALQLGRIAALELAPHGVRVNMVNADAVFGDDEVPSQLWAEVGPQRMASRGLDAAGLREHYRQRNLLKRTVTPRHVARAVLFFAVGAAATTGAVLPVDGGLPEAFPR